MQLAPTVAGYPCGAGWSPPSRLTSLLRRVCAPPGAEFSKFAGGFIVHGRREPFQGSIKATFFPAFGRRPARWRERLPETGPGSTVSDRQRCRGRHRVGRMATVEPRGPRVRPRPACRNVAAGKLPASSRAIPRRCQGLPRTCSPEPGRRSGVRWQCCHLRVRRSSLG